MLILILGLGLGLSSTSNKSESFVASSFSESSCVISGVDELELSSIAFIFSLRHYDEHKIKNKIK